MPERVVSEREVSIDGQYYHCPKGVQAILASIYPAKVVLGDTTRDSQQRASILSLSDQRGGLGLNRWVGGAEIDRFWWSTCNTQFRGHLLLGPLATETAASGVSGIVTVGAIAELDSEIYVAFGTSVRKYNNVTDSWGSALAALPAAATDAITTRINGTVYMIFATGTGYTHTTDGSSFDDENENVRYMEEWDDRLWIIDATGQLKWTNDLSITVPVWTSDAQLPLPDDYARDLFKARSATGEHILFCSTRVGLYAHDANNNRFVATELQLPFHPNSGEGSTVWRDSTYLAASESVIKYSTGPTAVVQVVGPDRDDGLISDYEGRIAGLIPSHNDLIAILDATAGTDPDLDMFLGSEMNSKGLTMQADLGRSAILAYNEIGWRVLWTSDDTTRAISYAHVSNAYSSYRLWWSHNGVVYWIALPKHILNPSQVRTFRFASSSTHETPWFNADQAEVDKLALAVKVEVADSSATETVKVEYAVNYADGSSDYTTLGTITADGTTEYLFPDATTPIGTAFRAIKFKLSFARGTTTSVSPDVINLTFVYRKKLPAKWGHSVELDLTNAYKGQTSLEQRARLKADAESTSLIEFTFRDDDGNTRNYFVDIVQSQGLEQTGHDERGIVRLTLVEP